MPPRKHGFHNNSHKNQKSKEHSASSAENENNPVLKEFHNYARELDDKHDRHERIVKLSRDITIESKRIIFLLHTIDGRKNNKSKVLDEAQQRLNKVIEVNFKAVAKELLGQDPYQYRSAYSPGLQEFIEAYSFMEYFRNAEPHEQDGDLNNGGISDWNALQSKMQYEQVIGEEKLDELQATTTVEETGEEQPALSPSITQANHLQKFKFLVDPTEYILGVTDLTGELMRRCINSLGSGETDACLETCNALKQFYTGYTSLNVQRCRELSRKIYTMRQSLLKTENVCYNLKVRGGEAAKWGAVFDGKPNDDVDEGFF